MEVIAALQVLPAKPIVVATEPEVIIEETVKVNVIKVPVLNVPVIRCDREMSRFLDSMEEGRETWDEERGQTSERWY